MFMTLTGLFIIFPPFYISLTGWLQGLAFAAEGMPPLGRGFAYLEFLTYYLAAVAGTNIGLSILFPKRYDTDSRRTSFKSAWKVTGYLYIWIAVILIIFRNLGGILFFHLPLKEKGFDCFMFSLLFSEMPLFKGKSVTRYG